MARFTWFNGNRGVWSYGDANLYSITTMSTTLLAGTYNGNDGPYNQDEHAFSFEATITGGALHTNTSGPDVGNTVYSDGTITRIDYFDSSHNLIMSITGLSLDASAFETLARQGVYLWDYIAKTGTHTFIGADNSFNTGGWDGDDIQTSHGRDTVLAKGGDDFISDKGGADKYNGGAGFDTLNYDQWQWNSGSVKSGIVADLVKGTIKGPDGFVDTILSIEGVRGSFLADRFLGNGKDNQFVGLGGKDYIDGKGGWDTIRYDRDSNRGGTDGINADMSTGKVRDGFGRVDTILNIEEIRGTDYDDVFKDNNKNNYFEGRDGNDVFKFSGGNDQVNGGGGADDFQFYGSFGFDRIEDFNQGEGDIITIQGPTAFGQLSITQSGTDTLIVYNGNSITLENFTAANLGAGDFVFI